MKETQNMWDIVVTLSMELIELWCEKNYWFKVKSSYIMTKIKIKLVKKFSAKETFTLPTSLPLDQCAKSGFGKNFIDTFKKYCMSINKPHVFCLGIIFKHCKETIAYTTSTVKI